MLPAFDEVCYRNIPLAFERNRQCLGCGSNFHKLNSGNRRPPLPKTVMKLYLFPPLNSIIHVFQTRTLAQNIIRSLMEHSVVAENIGLVPAMTVHTRQIL